MKIGYYMHKYYRKHLSNYVTNSDFPDVRNNLIIAGSQLFHFNKGQKFKINK